MEKVIGFVLREPREKGKMGGSFHTRVNEVHEKTFLPRNSLYEKKDFLPPQKWSLHTCKISKATSMAEKEAKARIKINKLLEKAGWRFLMMKRAKQMS